MIQEQLDLAIKSAASKEQECASLRVSGIENVLKPVTRGLSQSAAQVQITQLQQRLQTLQAFPVRRAYGCMYTIA